MPTYCNELVVGGQVKFSLKDDTVTDPSHIMAGYYGHLADGRRVLGTGQSGPSTTQHTIRFEFTDETSVTLTGYWDAAFITSAITATKPETYGSKTVETASLDGAAWYTRPTEVWETLLDDAVNFYPEADGAEGLYPYCWISSLADVEITEGSVWRVTYENNEYRLTRKVFRDQYGNTVYYIGNGKYAGQEDDGSGVPFYFSNSGYGAWTGGVEGANEARTEYFKIERLVTE